MMRFCAALWIAVFLAGPAMADVWSGILDRKTIRLGVRTDAAPFSYLDDENRPAGLAVKLCRAVVDLMSEHAKTRIDVAYVPVNAKERFPALLGGQTDLHCGPASATLERRKTLDFSILYFVDGAAAALRPDGDFETIFQVENGKFGALDGTTTQNVVADLIQRNSLSAEVATFPAHSRGLNALAEGKIDAYFGDQAILFFEVERQGLLDDVIVLEEVFSFEPYALVMKRGETELRLAVDRALSTIYERGMIYQLILEELEGYPLTTEAKTLYLVVGLP